MIVGKVMCQNIMNKKQFIVLWICGILICYLFMPIQIAVKKWPVTWKSYGRSQNILIDNIGVIGKMEDAKSFKARALKIGREQNIFVTEIGGIWLYVRKVTSRESSARVKHYGLPILILGGLLIYTIRNKKK